MHELTIKAFLCDLPAYLQPTKHLLYRQCQIYSLNPRQERIPG